ncbi:MAG TPA: alpha/beta hydrolase-fold protein [Rhizomicrobium sp.]|jgi:enterochelin esterase-like enzyme|nr:alpha/beta hydrolase-fold protein [Rhizomicrobium sp.]
MKKDPKTPSGTVHRLTLDSTVLKTNMLGDPTARQIDVYIPHGHDGHGLPLMVDLVGFTAGGPVHTNWKNFGENLPERLDRLIATGAMPPTAVAFPDCFTKLGGNQYVNSAAVGRWDDFLLTEAIPFVEKTYGCGGAGKRGVFGKSSGGYGAMVHALLHPDFWSAAASHSGDMGFDLLYRHEFVPVLRALTKLDFDFKKWVDKFWDAPKTKDSDVHIIMILAQAASFDPDPSAPYGLRLPVTHDTCELIAERWNNWLAFDPLTLVETHGPGLKQLKSLYIDCGDVDQYNLVYGARRMHKHLDTIGVKHTYEEFPDNHSSVDYRMDISLPILVKALST